MNNQPQSFRKRKVPERWTLRNMWYCWWSVPSCSKKMLKNTDKETQVISRPRVLTCNTSHHHVHHRNPPETLWVSWLLAPDPPPSAFRALSPFHVPLPCDVPLPPNLAVFPEKNAEIIQNFNRRKFPSCLSQRHTNFPKIHKTPQNSRH